MDMFAALRAFVSAVEKGAFARAAREQGISTSSLTRQVDALEARLATVLLNRSTRRLTLTAAGETYFERASQILAALEEANRAVEEAAGPPRGLLRVSLPVTFAQLHVSPGIPDFLRRHPGIELEVLLDDGITDLVAQRIDLAVRIGTLEPSNLIARSLAPQRRILCASPGYVAAHGAPAVPADLARHQCLRFAYGRGDRSWRFARGGAAESVRVDGPFRSNNSLPLREAALAGAGIILMPDWLVGGDIAANRLQPLLTDWEASPGSPGAAIHAVYLPSRRGSAKVKAFVAFLADRFGSPPYWSTQAAPGAAPEGA